MSAIQQPTLGNGKICYLEIPAINIAQSSSFYGASFDWKSRLRGDGATAFDDGVNQVSGSWVLNRKPMTEVGLMIYIMVDDIEETIRKIVEAGGTITQPVGGDAPEITARFSDPAGNILGLYQEPKQ